MKNILSILFFVGLFSLVQGFTKMDGTSFKIVALLAKSNGIEIEMSEPLSERSGNRVSDYQVSQLAFDDDGEGVGLEIQSVNISKDRKKVFLETQGLKPQHNIKVTLTGFFISQQGHELESSEATLAVKKLPKKAPGFVSPAKPVAPNTLTESEKNNNWELLFDGKSLYGWKWYGKSETPVNWKINDDALYCDASATEHGDLTTVNEYENFELVYDWKIQKNGNSGVMFNVVDNGSHKYPWETGPEMQVIDNDGHPDAKYPKHRAGDLYDMIKCKYENVKPAGEWNTAKIVIDHGQAAFWLNGHKLIEFTMFDKQWADLIANSKFKSMPDFGKATKGHLDLQDHGDEVWYRNIRIREIK